MSKDVLTGNFTKPQGYETRWIGLIFIGIALLVISLDNTIMSVALPSISRDLHATTGQLQWLTDGYTLVFASLLLTTGSLSDRHGRKKTVLFGLVIFGLVSATILWVNNINLLILVRALLGIAAALIMPSTLSLINVTFPVEERPRAIALWSVVFIVGMAFGPTLSGFLLQFFSWHALFLINVPIVVIALLGCTRFLTESRDESVPPVDAPGFLFSSSGIFALVYGIIEAGAIGWTAPWVLVLLGAATILLGLFIWWETRTPTPMLPMYLFKNMSFTGASLALTLVMFAMAGSMFFLSQYLQTVLGYTPLQAGLAMLPTSVVMAVFTPVGVIIMERYGVRRAVSLGLAIAASGLFYMGLVYSVNTPYLLVLIGQFILSIGMSTAITPATTSIMGAIPPSKSGIGSAMNDTTRELGNALGVAVLGTVMNSTYLEGVQQLRNTSPQLSDNLLVSISSNIQSAHVVAAQVTGEMGDVILKTANAAFVHGMNISTLAGAVFMASAAVFVFFTLPDKIQQTNLEQTNQTIEAALVEM